MVPRVRLNPRHNALVCHDCLLSAWRGLRRPPTTPRGISSVASTVAPPAPAIHLLRALLREVTYLPDPAARTYLHAYILQRFRMRPAGRDWQRLASILDFPMTPAEAHRQRYRIAALKLLVNQRRSNLLAKGAVYLQQLRAATRGEYAPLLRTLLATYGRTGRRRHELLAPLLGAPPGPASADPIHAGLPVLRPEVKARVPQLPPPVHAILQAQRTARLPPDTPTARANVRNIGLVVPATNSWKRPLPIRRVLNLAHAKYNALLKRVLPPLPDGEFERLRGLAAGTLACPALPKRRAQGVMLDEVAEGRRRAALRRPTDLEVVLSVDRPVAVKRARRLDEPLGGRHQAHSVTPRLMRRLWQRVFAMCCRLEGESGGQAWHVEWGRVRRKHHVAPDLVQELDSLVAKNTRECGMES